MCTFKATYFKKIQKLKTWHFNKHNKILQLMLIIKNTWFPFGRYTTLNLFGILFTKQDTLSERTIVHESIHAKQQLEMLFVLFYLWYAIEYCLIRLLHKTQNCAYHDVSFEEEAYANDDNKAYLSTRKHYAWLKYVKFKSNHAKVDKNAQQTSPKVASADIVDEIVATSLSSGSNMSVYTAKAIKSAYVNSFVCKCTRCGAVRQIDFKHPLYNQLTTTGKATTTCTKCNAIILIEVATSSAI